MMATKNKEHFNIFSTLLMSFLKVQEIFEFLFFEQRREFAKSRPTKPVLTHTLLRHLKLLVVVKIYTLNIL